jgi:hypothetical protein
VQYSVNLQNAQCNNKDRIVSFKSNDFRKIVIIEFEFRVGNSRVCNMLATLEVCWLLYQVETTCLKAVHIIIHRAGTVSAAILLKRRKCGRVY